VLALGSVLQGTPAVLAEGTQGVVDAQAAILPGPLTIPECTPLVVDETLELGHHLFSVSCRVVDATGSGNGWRFIITASAAGGPGTVAGGRANAPAATTLAEVTSVTQYLIAGAPAIGTGSITYPVPLYEDQAATAFDSSPNSGMGQLWLTIDGRIGQRQYIRFGAPSLTFSIVAGP
jgi:hypothetical protein